MKTTDVIADEMVKEARAWLDKNMDDPPKEGKRERRLAFGPTGRRSSISIVLRGGSGFWSVVGAFGPHKTYSGDWSRKNSEKALDLFNGEVRRMMEDLHALLSWLRKGDVDLRALVDEVEVFEVMEG